MKVLPFGSARSPANWGRAVEFIQAVLRLCRLLKIPTGRFVDDIYTCEGCVSEMSPFITARRIIELIGLRLAPKKDQGPSAKVLLLGADLHKEDDTVEVAISKTRETNIIALLGEYY